MPIARASTMSPTTSTAAAAARQMRSPSSSSSPLARITLALTMIALALLVLAIGVAVSVPRVSASSATQAAALSDDPNVQVWNFCYYMYGNDPAYPWSVVTSGSFVTGTPSSTYFTIKSMSGRRTQTVGSGSTSAISSQFITGVMSLGSITNDNQVNSVFPIFSWQGLAYSVTPVFSFPYQTSTYNYVILRQDPFYEVNAPAAAERAFIWQSVNSALALACPPPKPDVVQLRVITIPQTAIASPWSVCSMLSLEVIGPYYFPRVLNGQVSTSTAYIVQSAVGTRTFANSSFVGVSTIQATSLTGNPNQKLYTDGTFLDDEGLAVTLAGPVYTPTSVVTGSTDIRFHSSVQSDSYLRMVETGDSSISGLEYMQYEIATASTTSMSCPAQLLTRTWNYCYYSEGMHTVLNTPFTVRSSGLIFTSPVRDNSYYLISTISGVRSQELAGDHLTEQSFISSVRDLRTDTSNDNRLMIKYPYVSTGGVAAVLDVPVIEANATRVPHHFLASDPYGHIIEQTMPNRLQSYGYLVYQADPLDCDQLPVSYWAFRYLALPYSSTSSSSSSSSSLSTSNDYAASLTTDRWSTCATGTLSLLGPFGMPGGITYIVRDVQGSRLFIDRNGDTFENKIIGLSAAGSFSLYDASYLDQYGLSFQLDSTAMFPDGPELDPSTLSMSTRVFLHADPSTNGATLRESGTDVIANSVQRSSSVRANRVKLVLHDLSQDATPYTCIHPGDSVSFTTNYSYMVLSIVFVLLSGMIVLMSSDAMIAFRMALQARAHAKQSTALSAAFIAQTEGGAAASRFAAEKRDPSSVTLVPTFVFSFMCAAVALSGLWSGLLMSLAALSIDCAICPYAPTVYASTFMLILALMVALGLLIFALLTFVVDWFPPTVHRYWFFARLRRVVSGTTGDLAWRRTSKSNNKTMIKAPRHMAGGGGDEHSVQSVDDYGDRVSAVTSKSNLSSNGAMAAANASLQLEKSVTSSSVPSTSSAVRRRRTFANRIARKMGCMSLADVRNLVFHMYMNVSMHVVVSSLLLTAAIVGTRVAVSSALLSDFTMSYSVVTNIFSALIVWALSIVVVSFLFNAATPRFYRLRPIGALMLAVAFTIDIFLHLRTIKFAYHPSEWKQDHGTIKSYRIDHDTYFIVALVLGACNIAWLTLLRFSKMRSQQIVLAARMAHTKNKLTNAQAKILIEQRRHAVTGALLLEFQRCLDGMLLLRPSSGNLPTLPTQFWAFSTFTTDFLPVQAITRSVLFQSAQTVIETLAAQLAAAGVSVTGNGDKFMQPKHQFLAQLVCRFQDTIVAFDRRASAQQTTKATGITSKLSVSGGSMASSNADGTNHYLGLSAPQVLHANLEEEDYFLSQLQLYITQMDKLAAGGGGAGGNTLASPAPGGGAPGRGPAASRNGGGKDGLGLGGGSGKDNFSLMPEALPSTQIATVYRPTVRDVLSHPVTAELLKDEVERTHCIENMHFLLQLHKFKAIQSKPLKRMVATHMVVEFVAEGSPNQININASQRQAIQTRLNKSKSTTSLVDLFAAAEKEVIGLIETNNWKSFSSSWAYSLCSQILIRNAFVMSELAIRSDVSLRLEDVEREAQLTDTHDAENTTSTPNQHRTPHTGGASRVVWTEKASRDDDLLGGGDDDLGGGLPGAMSPLRESFNDPSAGLGSMLSARDTRATRRSAMASESDDDF